MAKVIGFNEDVAKAQEASKREGQRKVTTRKQSRNIHFEKGAKVSNKPFDVLKGLEV